MHAQDELFGHGFDNLLVNLVDGEVAADADDTIGLARGDFTVLFPDAAVEGVGFLLEAVFVGAGFGLDAGVAPAGARERGIEGRQQQEGQVRLQAAAEVAMQLQHNLGAKLASAALVSLGGVGKAVADDDLSRRQGRLDDRRAGLGLAGNTAS